MAINDNFHICMGTACGCRMPWALSPFSAWPLPTFSAPSPARCPATTRYTWRYGTETVGLQCHYGPGHDGDHASCAGVGDGDIFWPQEAPSPAEQLPEVPRA
jgi:hypothetical protein